MIKRTIEISQLPAHVTVQHSQLVLKREGVIVGQAPCEDEGVVLVDQPGVTYSHAALTALAAPDGVRVVWGRNRVQVGGEVALGGHHEGRGGSSGVARRGRARCGAPWRLIRTSCMTMPSSNRACLRARFRYAAITSWYRVRTTR